MFSKSSEISSDMLNLVFFLKRPTPAYYHNPGLYSFLVLWICYITGCQPAGGEVRIPHKYVGPDDKGLVQREGFLYYHGVPFSGYTLLLYASKDTASITGYIDGKEEGWAKKWYANGDVMEERFYAGGRKEGIHKGWRPGGHPAFVYQFENDEYNGEVAEWYENDTLARRFRYTAGHEDGLQQMWWPDGKRRANYIVKDGRAYGLIGRKLCKNKTNEKL